MPGKISGRALDIDAYGALLGNRYRYKALFSR